MERKKKLKRMLDHARPEWYYYNAAITTTKSLYTYYVW